MIRYTASDVVTRALQLADLENSDFLSWKEKIICLNEAYTTLYQKLVNKGDDNFIKEIVTSSSVIELPSDFWQIRAITLENYGTVIPLMRRPMSQSSTIYPSYDLIGNTIRINGNTTNANVKVLYYPTPVTLTLPNERKAITVEDGIIDAHGDIYLTSALVDIQYPPIDDSEPTIVKERRYVVRSFTDPEMNIIIYGIPQHTGDASDYYEFHMDDEYIVFYNSEYFYIFDINLGLWEELSNSAFCPLYYKGKMLIYNNAEEQVELFEGEKLFNYVIEDFDNILYAFLDDDKQNIVAVYIDTNVFTPYIKRNGTQHTFNRTITKTYLKGNKLYIFTNTNYFAIMDIVEGTVEDLYKDEVYINVLSFDDNSGYGYLTTKYHKNYIVSFLDNTELDFPNNMYFNYLSYLLAYAFKTKQGSDASQLSVLVAQAEETFYDTLTKDDWGVLRITNIY